MGMDLSYLPFPQKALVIPPKKTQMQNLSRTKHNGYHGKGMRQREGRKDSYQHSPGAQFTGSTT